MKSLSYYILIALFQAFRCQSELELAVLEEFAAFENMIVYPMSSSISELDNILDHLAENSSRYQAAAEDLIETNPVSSSLGLLNISNCERLFEAAVKIVKEEGLKEVNNVVTSGVLSGQRILADNLAVINAVQNKSLELGFAVQKCMDSSNSEDCLSDKIEEIKVKKISLAGIVPLSHQRHAEKLRMLEQSILNNLEMAVFDTLAKLVAAIDDLLICAIS